MMVAMMDMDMDMDPFTPSPTPPVPLRNPDHRFPHWHPLPLIPESRSKQELVPKPLFSKRTRLPPPPTLHVAVYDIESPTSELSKLSSPPSPTASFRSVSSNASSTAPSSTSSSPSVRPRSLTYAFPPPDVGYWRNPWEPAPLPKHALRRKPSPRKETLRSLRVKESEACLQRAYDQQVEAYLDGSLFQRVKWKDDLGRVEEE